MKYIEHIRHGRYESSRVSREGQTLTEFIRESPYNHQASAEAIEDIAQSLSAHGVASHGWADYGYTDS